MEFRSATTIDELLGWLSELGDDAQILAGGTDVMMQLGRGDLDPGVMVHIEHVPGLDTVEANGSVRLGGLVSHLSASRNPVLLEHYGGIAHAASTVGGWQTQAIGTIAGNICNASPAADLAAPLLVNGAEVTLASVGGQRRVPLEEFVLGRRHTDRRPDELVVGFELASVPERSADIYLKVGRRAAMEVAVVGLAARVSLDEDLSTIASAQVAACSVAEVPFRAHEVEDLLRGAGADSDLAEAGRALQERSDPIDDARATASYRRRILPGILQRAVSECVAQIRTRAS